MWKLRLIDTAGMDACPRLEPGDVAYAPWVFDHKLGRSYTDVYSKDRVPIVIGLPNSEAQKESFGADPWYPDLALPDGDGWQVQGLDLEKLTITPSINAVGSYHGWVTNGVLTDDCEGRTFPHWPDRT